MINNYGDKKLLLINLIYFPMKKLLLIIFVYAAYFTKAQCSFSASVTPVQCFGQCNGTVTFYLSAGCGAYPYSVLVSNGGGCPFTNSLVLTSSVTSVVNQCACASPFTAILYDNLANLVGVTNFSLLSPPAINIITTTTIQASCGACCNGSISTFVFGGAPPFIYTWTAPGGSVVATTSTLTNACPGTYTFCAVDTKGCQVCNTYSVGFGTGINELQTEPVKIIYGEDKITFENSTTINYFSAFDLTGRLIFKSEALEQNYFILNKTTFTRGVYIVYIESSNNISRQKIIID